MRNLLLVVVLGCLVAAPSFADPKPKPVTIVDQPVATQSSKTPVAFFSVVAFGTGDVAVSDTDVFSVPAGQRLVIEQVSIDTAPTSCTFNLFTEVQLTTGGEAIGHDLPVAPSYQGSAAFRRNVMSTLTRLYGDSESNVRLLLNRSDVSCSSVVSFKASGYLEEDL